MSKKILVIAAHPDDEVYGMGGTICRRSSLGDTVHILIVTEGCTSQYRGDAALDQIIAKKEQEAQRACAILGAAQVHFGRLPDMRLDMTSHVAVNEVIENAVRKIQPDVVYTHFWGDVNLDHSCVYRSSVVACRPVAGQCVKELYCYSVPSSTEWAPPAGCDMFCPNCFVDISAQLDRKLEALSAYQTELRPYPHPRSPEYVRLTDTAAGLRCGIGPAEEFICLRKIEV